MKLQQVILSIVAFIVVLIVTIYPLHLIAVELFPDAGTLLHYAVPEILGLILAIAAAVACWRWSGRQKKAEE